MAYIGSTPTSQNFISGTDYFNGTGSQTAFTLTRTVNSVNDIEAVVNNVVQRPNDAYTLSGTTITFTSAPSSGTNNIYIRYLSTTLQSITVPANSITRNQLDSNLQSVAIGKNKIINGAMVIDQRNAGASVTANDAVFVVDRFRYSASQTGKATSQQSSTAPIGFTNSVLYTSSSAYSVTSTDYFLLSQRIEGYNIADLNWGTANAKTVTLSFWVQSSLTGTFGGAIQNNGSSRSYPFSYTIGAANTWTQISVVIPGDTSGTWLTTNGLGMIVWFGLGCGATYSGTAGAWASANYGSSTGATSVVGTNGATFYITGVQLEVGSSATGFEYENYTSLLQKCQRYFEMSFPQGTAPANGVSNYYKFIAAGLNGSTAYTNCGVFCVEKRSSPTMTFYRTDNGSSNGQPAYFSGGTWNNGSSISPASSTRAFQYNYGGSFSANSAYFTDVSWTASSEL